MDKWSGIAVRKHNTLLEIGDSIKITGLVAERSGNVTEIVNGYDFEILKKGVYGISPVEVTTGEVNNDGGNGEAYEGMLIKVSGECDSDNLGGQEWGINDGTGQARILPVYLTDFSPVIGMHYQVSGIQYFSSGNFKIVPWSNADVITEIENGDEFLPLEYKLYNNFPNPFNPVTTITYSIPEKSMVLLKVYDILGKEAAVLVNELRTPGEYKIKLNSENLSSGVYFYNIEVNNFTASKKMLLIK
jgi:hypothetical protein